MQLLRRLASVLAGCALALPAGAQIHVVQQTPADAGTTMMLAITGATPSVALYLTGAGAWFNASGSPGTFGTTVSPIPRTMFAAGTSNALGALTVSIPVPSSAALLGRLLPLRAIDSGALPLGSGGVFSNPLAIWFGPHPVSVSPAPEMNGGYGWSVAVGDFVGSSDLDVAVGAVLETVSGAFGAGRVHVYEGPLFTSVTTLTSPAPSAGGDFGWALAALDWNGDGTTDLAVGEPGKDGLFPLSNIGAVHVFLHPAGTGGVTSYTDPTPVANEQMGVALAAATLDVSPSDELVAGASFNGAVQPAGVFASVKVFAYAGGPATFSEVAEPTSVPGLFGHAVAAGDVDGDGFDEILVGEPNHDETGAFDCGAAHLIDGGAIALTLIDDAPASGEKLGAAVALGDLDGDGLGDLLIGVPLENVAQVYLAPAFASASPPSFSPAHPGDIHGGRAVAIADVNGDGANDALVVAGSCAAPGPGVICGSITAYLGPALAAAGYVADSEILPWSIAAGDLDGDGRAEIAVGAPDADPAFVPNAGACLVSK